MSTVQQTKPRFANQSITDESGRPGTVRSNVGCEAIDEPCTNSTAGLPSGESTNFSHRKRRTPLFSVQCSTPVTLGLTLAEVRSALAVLVLMSLCFRVKCEVRREDGGVASVDSVYFRAG